MRVRVARSRLSRRSVPVTLVLPDPFGFRLAWRHEMRTPLVVMFVVVMICTALAEASDPAPLVDHGNDFIARCSILTEATGGALPEGRIDAVQYGYCGGYIESFIWTLAVLDLKQTVCTPDGVQSVQVARIVTKYIKDHPDTAHEPTVMLALKAMRAAFP